MRVTGLKIVLNEAEIVKVLRKHTELSVEEAKDLAKKILNGASVDLEEDWALEQDLKEIGVRVH